MIAVDIGKELIIPSSVAVVGAVVAGISAMIKAWFENRDARRRTEQQLKLARERTEFVEKWITVSKGLRDDEQDAENAVKELKAAYAEAQVAFDRAHYAGRTVMRQLRQLLMLERRRNSASYVVSGVFLFVSSFVWLLFCIPQPGDDEFSYLTAIISAILTTFVLRAVAGLLVGLFERFNRAWAIVGVAASNGVATITTAAAHGLRVNRTVRVDASGEDFDGEFTITEVPTPTTFRFELRHSDVPPIASSGSVFDRSFSDQMRTLLMLDGGRSWPRTALSGAFLLFVVLFASAAAVGASGEIDDDIYPMCYGENYDGGYFGDELSVPDVLINGYGMDQADLFDDDGGIVVDGYRFFLEQQVPLWSRTEIAGITIVEETEEQYETESASGESYWVLRSEDGDEFVIDGWVDDELGSYYDLYYYDGGTVLYEHGAGDRLEELGDPCDPQSVNVTVSSEPVQLDFGRGALLFGYVNAADELVYVLDGAAGRADAGTASDARTMQIDGYFGRDGRFIPVCGDDDIQPCIVRDDVYYDSGLYATLLLLFEYVLGILVIVILVRLVFWAIDRGIIRLETGSWGSPPPSGEGDPEGGSAAGTAQRDERVQGPPTQSEGTRLDGE